MKNAFIRTCLLSNPTSSETLFAFVFARCSWKVSFESSLMPSIFYRILLLISMLPIWSVKASSLFVNQCHFSGLFFKRFLSNLWDRALEGSSNSWIRLQILSIIYIGCYRLYDLQRLCLSRWEINLPEKRLIIMIEPEIQVIFFWLITQPALNCSNLTMNARTRCEICCKLIWKTPEQYCSVVFIANFDHILHLALVFLLLTLNM